METDSHDSISSEKCFFNAITVMHINVNVENSREYLQEFQDTYNDVVEIAESICFTFFGMMKATTPINSNICCVVDYQMSCIDRATFCCKNQLFQGKNNEKCVVMMGIWFEKHLNNQKEIEFFHAK